MTRIARSAIVAHPAARMYALVADVDRYKEFLPWCGGSRVTSRTDDSMIASVDIDFKGVRKRFTTRNSMTPGSAIRLDLVDGPFRSLHGHWRFTPLGDAACKVALELEFDFKNRLLGAVVGPVFARIVDGMVDAFRARADETAGETALLDPSLHDGV